MDERKLLKSIDASTEGIETLAENVAGGIADEKNGWFGARIKLVGGAVAVVQVTTDIEIGGATATRKSRKRT